MANVIGEPRVVEAGRGAAWWGDGWHIFDVQFLDVDRHHDHLHHHLDADQPRAVSSAASATGC